MKRFNLLYLVAIPLIYGWTQMCGKIGNTSAFFYGFAENKETELRHDKAVSIDKIWVTPGQEVREGDLLMEVQQSEIDFKIENVNHDLERLDLLAQEKRQNIRDKIAQLNAKRSAKLSVLKGEIDVLETTIQQRKELMKDLKSIEVSDATLPNSPAHLKIEALKKRMLLDVEPIDIELKQLQQELAAIRTPSQVEKEKLTHRRAYYQQERGKLRILAPTNGLVGNIHCKEGEVISPFSTLINFYERKPTLVRGFVHESLILQVQKYDSLQVSSSLQPSQPVNGMIIGLGSRIVEIPERLRKIPDLKTYGREVLIQIPSDNPFLQKEELMLNTLDTEADESLASLFSFFRGHKR